MFSNRFISWLGRITEGLLFSIRARVILSYLVIVGVGFYYLTRKISEDVRPRYLEAVEETMVDVANVLASVVEESWKGERIDIANLQNAYASARARTFSAPIYELTKTKLDLQVYVTDAMGKVIFDSNGGKAVGSNYYAYNDVRLTLAGQYGARATRTDSADPSTSILYVAAPIRHEGKIAGVLTVSKPVRSIATFMEHTRKRILILATVSAVGVSILGVLFSAWLTYPIRNLIAYAKAIRDGLRPSLPNLGHSEIRSLGAAFEEMRDALEGKNYVNRYVQTLTHEIKSPVAAIRGAAELLQEEMPVQDRNRFLANIQTETVRIQEVVDSLLLLASVETKKAIEFAAPVDLGQLAQGCLEKLSVRMKLRAISVKSNLPNSPIMVRGDAFLLERTLLNLLENALAFSPQGSCIHLNLAASKGGWELVIEDQGPGIPDYALSRVFERFFSLPRPDTGKKSSGLGLAFVKEVALLHGGFIEVVNRTEGGVRAMLWFPKV